MASPAVPSGPVWRPRLVFLLVTVVAALLYLINLRHAPDFDADEVLYTMAGHSVAEHNSISFNGAPIYVHPPLYFIAVGGWLRMFGDLHASLLASLYDARYLNALFCVGDAVLTASLCRAWYGRVGRWRNAVVVMAGLLVAINPFMLRFGRSVLIEPMAVFLGLLAVRVAWGLRHRPHGVYIPVYGTLLGVAVLSKETALAVAIAPVVSAVIRRNRTEIMRNVAAVAVAAFVFSSFVMAFVLQGRGHALYEVQSLNLRRLLGLVHITGLNRGQGVSPTVAFTDTFRQYSGGYFLLILGGIALIVGVVKAGRNFAKEEAAAALIGLGVVGYVFLLYSVFFGQSNEQLTVYAVPASALLALLAWDLGPRPRRMTRELRIVRLPRIRLVVEGIGLLAVLVAASASWVVDMAVPDDTAIMRTEQFISASLPTCVPIDATGDPFGWATTLRTNPVVEYATGPTARANGIHVFLISPKDAKFRYGKSSPRLSLWVSRHGELVSDIPSHTYDRIQVWEVGTVKAPQHADVATCANPLPPPADHAKATIFGATFGSALLLVAAGYGVAARRRRRSPVTTPDAFGR